jgi:hypothetical protein
LALVVVVVHHQLVLMAQAQLAAMVDLASHLQ